MTPPRQFGVEDWDKSLRALVTHAALSILGDREFEHILRDRSELVRQDIKAETERWTGPSRRWGSARACSRPTMSCTRSRRCARTARWPSTASSPAS
ncbi:hypothetical protein [Archangium sp.]|uniref:hypothetical protein n=1 Tax=Archangium sp. TaxID=1872627 RepID=UPI002ED8595D